jgi:phosphinothricin acetyltransferase
MIIPSGHLSNKKYFRRKIRKGFPVLVAELDGIAVGFGMYSEFRFREAYKTVEHSVYVNENHHGRDGKLLTRTHSAC